MILVLSVVPEKKTSDIIDRLAEKRRRDHNEAVCQLQTELSSISVVHTPIYVLPKCVHSYVESS